MDERKEKQVNGLIREFLAYGEYTGTLSSFDAECLKHDRAPIKLVNDADGDKRNERVENQLITSFRQGDNQTFTSYFNQVLPPSTRTTDPVSQKLEFMLAIHFAVYPINPCMESSQKAKYNPQQNMDDFKVFLEKRGSEIAKISPSVSSQFLPFFALPYIPDPTRHPGFQEVFDVRWTQELEARWLGAVRASFKAELPRIVKFLDNLDARPIEESRAQTKQIHELESQIHQLEDRHRHNSVRQRELQNDHHNLIAIASELVQALAACINGEQITSSYLTNICDRLVELKHNHRILDQAAKAAQLPPPAPVKSRMPPKRSTNLVLDGQLDYSALHRDLAEESFDRDRKRELVLQALRLRLTTAPDARTRQTTLLTFVHADFLGLGRGSVALPLGLLKSSHTRGQFARLLNAISSGCTGRSYLLSGLGALVVPVSDALQREGADSPSGKNLLGTLQKLSLRRGAQTAMIKAGLIQFLLPVLSSPHLLSEYALEYASALLMNLLLRTAGRQQTIEQPDLILSVLEGLVRIPNPEVKTYANGALYSVLSEPKIRRRAQQLGVGELLVEIRGHCDAYLAKQVDYVLGQLDSKENPPISDTVSEDGQDEDYEDDNEQNEVGEEDLNDDLLNLPNDVVIGDELLTQRYTLNGKPPTVVKNVMNPGGMVRTADVAHIENNSALDLRRPRTPSRNSTRPSTPASSRPSTSAGKPGVTTLGSGGIRRSASSVSGFPVRVVDNGPDDVPPVGHGLIPRSSRDALEFKYAKREEKRSDGASGGHNEGHDEETTGFSTRQMIARTPLSNNSVASLVAS
ncbi:hypothetical protein SmJEL517_g05140 [Synchytrium microbalum]|uniref:LisH domain-containing protein ARMC9 n=1 Tax=Synchytrium microbalum TaxID=1806994 RepID=A0A507C1Z6_9FUNG|nr:uncharacterized protein SmJEL517_g05140 [Synchytrium microbalum]TPX31555.1 hypothetical protein SmJEL517_g05140 [Synchytrium microbalum]